jgi:hypothetical protein
MATLLQNQATLVQTQAAFVAQKAESDRRMTEIDQRIAEYERLSTERFARIEALLLEHNRMLEALPEAIREKIGFKVSEPPWRTE